MTRASTEVIWLTAQIGQRWVYALGLLHFSVRPPPICAPPDPVLCWKHARVYGFTAAEAWAATSVQKAWRGRVAREHFHLLLRAQRICK